jgi:hypothetical protein
MEEITENLRKLNNDRFHNLYSYNELGGSCITYGREIMHTGSL